MTEQRDPNLWLRPSPPDEEPYAPERDPYGATSVDDFRAPPDPAPAPDPEPSHDPFAERKLKRGGGGIAAIGLLIAKFFAKIKLVLLFLPKLKILTTSGSMLVSVAAYSLIWGWRFALGFVVLLFVHEMGHVIQLRREGIKASAPIFIPFFGAAVWSKSLGGNALSEARVGLAGPVLGSIGAAACIPIANATGNDYWRALAFTGFFLNLFNLLPVVPLDGGRAMAAMSPWMWGLGLFGIAVLAFTYPNPIILLIALLAVMETWRRWRALKSGDESVRSYYRVPPVKRAIVAAVYLGLIALLVLGMDATHVARTFADA